MINNKTLRRLILLGGLLLPAKTVPVVAEPSAQYFPIGTNQIIEIIGDSIGGPGQIYPMIEQALPARRLFGLGASCGGNTLRDALGRLDRDAMRTDLDSGADVNWYITMFGANDAALFDAQGFEANYRRLIEIIKRRTHAHLTLVATPCFTPAENKANKRLSEFADVVAKLGREYSLATVDLYHPCLEQFNANSGTPFMKDSIHPAAAGHKFMAETFLKQFNFYGLSEQVEVDLATLKTTGTTGCDATIAKTDDGLTLTLVNRWDFKRKIGLVLHDAEKFDIFDATGTKLDIQNGRAIPELPEPSGLLLTDLAAIRSDTTTPANAQRLAGDIETEAQRSRVLKLRLLPKNVTAVAVKESESVSIFEKAIELANLAKSNTNAQRFVDQFTDLRVNFLKERFPKTAGSYALRDLYGVTRVGDAAAKPIERFEVVFINHEAPNASGEIRIAATPKGWNVKAVTPTTFTGLIRGQRFTVEFELTGEETCTWQGEMLVAANFKLSGNSQPVKQAVVQLFSPWLGIGTFCDTKERETASIEEKFAVIYPPEKTIDPAATFTRFDGKALHWQAFRSFYSHPGVDRSGQIQWIENGMRTNGKGGKVFDPWKPAGVLYIAKWVYSPVERDVKLLPVFSSRAAKLWLNGTAIINAITLDIKVWRETETGMNWTAWNKTEYYTRKTVDAHLIKGWNSILFKLVSNSRPSDTDDIFDLKIFSTSNNLIPDLLGSCFPPAVPK